MTGEIPTSTGSTIIKCFAWLKVVGWLIVLIGLILFSYEAYFRISHGHWPQAYSFTPIVVPLDDSPWMDGWVTITLITDRVPLSVVILIAGLLIVAAMHILRFIHEKHRNTKGTNKLIQL